MSVYDEYVAPINQWKEEDRPREKLLHRGKQQLTDAELLAILIGSGSKNESAISLCKRVLDRAANNLNQLGKLSVYDLMKFKGIGKAKAISIIAALELGRRRQSEHIHTLEKITSSKDVYLYLLHDLTDIHHEAFWIVYLNRSNHILGKECISTGGLHATVVDAKILFKKTIDRLATSIILAHNHPSGNTNPSQADIDLTKQLSEAGKLLDIIIVDHIIIGESDFFSFADEGIL